MKDHGQHKHDATARRVATILMIGTLAIWMSSVSAQVAEAAAAPSPSPPPSPSPQLPLEETASAVQAIEVDAPGHATGQVPAPPVAAEVMPDERCMRETDSRIRPRECKAARGRAHDRADLDATGRTDVVTQIQALDPTTSVINRLND